MGTRACRSLTTINNDRCPNSSVLLVQQADGPERTESAKRGLVGIDYNSAYFDTTVQRVALIMDRPSMRTVLRILSATMLFSAAGIYEAVHASALLNGDIWWHLRTGIWILQNHAVPHTGLFSQYSDLPWIASSWGFDVLLATAYRVCGLRSIPLLLMAFKVALAVVTFLLARVGRVNFWSAVLLSILAQYVIAGLQSAPATLSILFFGVELILLLRSLRCGSLSNLFLLPPLFLLWANLHVQFIYGLLLLCILLIALSLERILLGLGVTWTSNLSRPLPLAKVFGLAGLSVLCTLANPYSFRIYAVIPRVLYSDVSFQYFADMHSMSFRRPSEFALMLLVMAAFFALGRNRPPNLFELLALCAGAAVAFRIQREVWLAVLPAIAILGSGLHFGERPPTSVSDPGQQWEKPLTAVMVVAVLAVAVFRLPGKN